MHQLFCADNLAAKRLAYRLMSQAHSQDRYLARETLHNADAYPRFSRRAGPRRNHDSIGIQRLNLVQRNLVVPLDYDVASHLPQVLDQVVRERIVIVYHQYHLGQPVMRLSDCREQRLGLVQALLMLSFRHGICHYPRTGLHIRGSIVDDNGPDANRSVHIAGM